MLYAKNKDGEKITATPNSKAICPLCDSMVISKCGTINEWHWSHKSLVECDSWSEGESLWHYKWKNLVKKEFCEIKIRHHRADIFNGINIIELQNSPLDFTQIYRREAFYKNLIWLYNANEFSQNIEWRRKENQKTKDFVTFRWKHPRKSMWAIKKPLFLDLGTQRILHIKKMYETIPCGGWGYIYSKNDFIIRYLKPVLKKEVLEKLKDDPQTFL